MRRQKGTICVHIKKDWWQTVRLVFSCVGRLVAAWYVGR